MSGERRFRFSGFSLLLLLLSLNCSFFFFRRHTSGLTTCKKVAAERTVTAGVRQRWRRVRGTTRGGVLKPRRPRDANAARRRRPRSGAPGGPSGTNRGKTNKQENTSPAAPTRLRPRTRVSLRPVPSPPLAREPSPRGRRVPDRRFSPREPVYT